MDLPSYSISGQSGWTNMDNISVLPYSGHFKSLDHAADPVYSQGQQVQPCANPTVGQIACLSAVKTSPPSGASNILQQAMNLSMITSPPCNPYSYYDVFSPITPNISSSYSPGYMSNLRRNPMFQDLQMLLAEECNGVQVPANLITTSWNLMQLPLMDSSAGVISGSQDVYLRHMQLQDKLLKVRIDPHVSADGLKVENEYSTKVGQIEMGRYQALVSNMGNTILKAAVNSYYDKERVTLAWKMEVDLDRLIAKAEEIRKSVTRVNVMQKENSQGRLPKWNVVQTQGVVRQLTFGGLDDSGEKDSFDSGFKSDVEDFDVDIEAISDNDKKMNLNKNCAKINGVSQLCSLKQKTIADILYEDEKCSDKISFIQPNSTENMFPAKPLSDETYPINNDNLMTPDQSGSSQSSFNCHGLSLLVLRKEPKNTVICTPELRNSPSVELSPLNDQSDFLLRIACGSSGKLKDVQSNLESQVQSPIVSFHPELQASSNSQQSSYLDKPTYTISGMNHSKENTNLPSHSHLPCLKTHKILSNDAAKMLSTWYEQHLQYPYPTDKEVKELSELTGATEKQVKKWMANKRIRCFNTLSITGNKHPIKFKYEGRGKKRKHPEMEKDDSSNFEPNFNGLTEESRRILNSWFDSHIDNPYPLEEEKKELALQCGITLAQVKSWFANKRSRTNNTRKQVPNYFIKKFPQYAPMVQVIGEQREQARIAKKCRFSNFTNMMPFM